MTFRRVTLAGFDARAEEYDRCVLSTPEIDHFCSSAAWVIPASRALMRRRPSWIWRCRAGWVAFLQSRHPQGFLVLEPLESMWGLASPLIGPDLPALARAAAGLLRERSQDWSVLVLSGLPQGSEALRQLAQHLPECQLRLSASMQRHVASLEGGLEGFLARRSAQFRSRLRRTRKKARREGFTVEYPDDPSQDPERLYRRILEVERLSWKGHQRVGIDSSGLGDFYRRMIPRLLSAGRLRLGFLRKDGADAAYILGGVLGDAFRGLQFSYDERYASRGLGNVAQLEMIERLSGEGIGFYDLGTDIAYKRRWAEGGLKTVTLLVYRV